MAKPSNEDDVGTVSQDRRAFLGGMVAGSLAMALSGCSAPTGDGDDASGGGGAEGGGGGGGGGADEPQRIDVHTHLIRLDPADSTEEVGRQDADELVKRMDGGQIDKVVLLAITERLLWGLAEVADDFRWKLDDLTKQNDICLAARDRYPDRIEVFIGLDWRGYGQGGWPDQAVSQLTQAFEKRGASGIKFHIGQATSVLFLNRAVGLADDHQFMSDERLAPVFTKLWELGGVPLIHVGDLPTVSYPQDAPPFWDLDAATYQHFEMLLKAFPDKPFIVAHLGCLLPNLNPHTTVPNAPPDYTRLRTLLDEHPNLYADLAGKSLVLSRVALTEEGAHSTRQLMLDYPDRLLFGTDFGPAQKDFPAYEIYNDWLSKPLGETFRNSYLPEVDIHPLGLDSTTLGRLYDGNYKQIRASLKA